MDRLGGFAAAIEALNIAYHAKETSPLSRTQPLAMALTLVMDGLLLVALATVIAGPPFRRIAVQANAFVTSLVVSLAVHPLDAVD